MGEGEGLSTLVIDRTDCGMWGGGEGVSGWLGHLFRGDKQQGWACLTKPTANSLKKRSIKVGHSGFTTMTKFELITF